MEYYTIMKIKLQLHTKTVVNFTNIILNFYNNEN